MRECPYRGRNNWWSLPGRAASYQDPPRGLLLQERALRDVADQDAADPNPTTRGLLSASLNVPYDDAFQSLYLAYIAGMTAFGLVPRATLEIPGGARRLDRILELISSCRYSFHDLSRVELDVRRPATPRFNMPFELGLEVALDKLNPGQHVWFVLETKTRRLQKSLSDLGGTDVYIHGGKPRGVFRELCNALVRTRQQPTVQQMNGICRGLVEVLPEIKRRAGAKSAFAAPVFADLIVTARALADHSLAENSSTRR